MKNLDNPASAVLDTPFASALRENDLVCFSHLRWHFVTQRPQHLLTRAARDRRVFYWEEPIWHHDAKELPINPTSGNRMSVEVMQEAASLWVIQPHLMWGIDCEEGQRTLLADFMAAFDIQRYDLWYYTPMALGFSDQLRPQRTVYDCMDELSAFHGAPAQLAERERQLFRNADVVFTGGISLYEHKRSQHSNVHAFPSSIDAGHFAQAKSAATAEPADQAALPHPRAGFYGVIDERLDLVLLEAVARLKPEIHFILLGPVVKIDPAALPQLPNIHYLGAKSYADLPAYLAGWDVGLLPFALNDATRFISPTKTPEYLAAGKPVVSTPIRDVVRGYGEPGLVAIATSPADFAAAVDRALKAPLKGWLEAVEAKLATSSWDSTWQAMRNIMSAVEPKRLAHVSPRPSENLATKKTSAISTDLAALPVDVIAARGLPRRIRNEIFDSIVIGAGFAGSVLAERLATQRGERVLLIDRRNHIAGNAYDFYNEDGILVHKYGPHIFHTNSEKVLAYLSRFTAWRSYEHRVLASVDGKLLPVPINLDTINQLYGLNLDGEGMKAFLSERAVVPEIIRTSEDIVVSRVGRELYEKFFRNYTRKQWGVDPSELDSSVAGRIPVRFDRDDRYFSDKHQVMPLHGYTRMFERMLDQPNLTVRTGVEYQEIARLYPSAKIIFTGPIDEYFEFRYGALPYRSLEFKHETHDCEFVQQAPVINYPNDHEYTRVTEFKYLTGQKKPKTSIVYEFPRSTGDPYYPIPRPENAAIYARYQQLAMRDERVTFCGRLATYRYLNMDQVVAQALSTFERIAPPLAVTSSRETALLHAAEPTLLRSTPSAVALPD